MKTKNDLSYNEVKLDYATMLETSAIALYMCREALSQRLNESYNQSMKKDFSGLKNNAERLAEVANDFMVASDMYYTLIKGLERENIEVVNKSYSK